jgi:hypothetical protein
MRSLLLYNNNLNQEFVKIFDVRHVIYPSKAEMVSEDFNMDLFIHNRLKEIFLNNKFECIYIPYTLNTENHIEYSGLLVALHIRLTHAFMHELVPIVFLGYENAEQVFKVTDLGSVLFSPCVHFLKEQTIEAKSYLENWMVSKKSVLSSEDYNRFLSMIKINPPANYNTHHSIANEWSLIRLSAMFKEEKDPELAPLRNKIFNDVSQSILTQLYFKFLSQQRARQEFKKDQHKISAAINGIKGKSVMYIDDEGIKGWYSMMGYIFKKSDGNLVCCPDINKDLAKESLVKKIEEFIDSLKIMDVYIIDLRLHDDDFKEEINPEQLTGNRIIKYITDKNDGAQILVFSASNKIWNFKKAIDCGASGYSIKESPENFFTREESKEVFFDFADEVKKLCERSFLKDVFSQKERIKNNFLFVPKSTEGKTFVAGLIEKKGWLDNIYELLKIGSGETLNQALLICFQVLENYVQLPDISDFGYANSLPAGSIWTKASGRVDIFNSVDDQSINTRFDLKFDFYPFQTEKSKERNAPPESIAVYDKLTLKSAYRKGVDVTTLVIIIAVLKFRHNIDTEEIENVMLLRYLRSNLAAHLTGTVDQEKRKIAKEDIFFMMDLFEKLFAQ